VLSYKPETETMQYHHVGLIRVSSESHLLFGEFSNCQTKTSQLIVYPRELIGKILRKTGFPGFYSPDKQTPEQNHQVHHQEDGPDPGLRGPCHLGTDVVEPIAIFALAEFSLYRNALQGILFTLLLRRLDLLGIQLRIFHRSPQRLAANHS
jgi:hypothetical protein